MADRAIPNAGVLKGWRKSSYSNDQGGSCLEILDNHPMGVPVRDSKVPEGPAPIFPSTIWTSFIAAVRNGYFSA
ncbi:DUF397 domain-containing protein [Streptomyces colonosanans]|uniref:DUF397 domain-containing protein n=1 Tax=Streptomyces colonosanans TaxID=1428652 RepID=A0A1S2NST4_9ACTN|nr:DUF397 domain-containing protein [Streptomyces colonosanans]OIJ84618.1 DUF397 domain-containing protein [Streptomyces colonosanans]